MTSFSANKTFVHIQNQTIKSNKEDTVIVDKNWPILNEKFIDKTVETIYPS